MSISAYRELDLQGLDDLAAELTPKIIYAGGNSESDPSLGFGQAYIAVREDLLSLVASLNNVISVTTQYGISLGGPLSISAMPDQVSIGGGYWRINPLVLTCLPSTSATPVPWLVRSAPKLVTGQSEINDALSFMKGFSDMA